MQCNFVFFKGSVSYIILADSQRHNFNKFVEVDGCRLIQVNLEMHYVYYKDDFELIVM